MSRKRSLATPDGFAQLLDKCREKGILVYIFEPGHEKTCLMSYANNKGADQPPHPRSLISAFVVGCLDSVMSLVSVIKISSLMLAAVAEQASLSLTWAETPEDTCSHDEAHLETGFIAEEFCVKLLAVPAAAAEEFCVKLLTVPPAAAEE